MALLRKEGSIHAIDGKYPDKISNSNKEKIEGDALSVIQLSIAPNVLCEVSTSTEETTKKLWKSVKGLYQNRKDPITLEQVRQEFNSCDVKMHFEGDKGDEASGLFVRGRTNQQGRRKSKYRSKSRVNKKNVEC
ncbi:hypothetical protein KY290_024508 [Solanum tuberosum]|uniref:Uncharacterized protein n=1 Tax=Solanum tuberosum TaxID=4113 RepID=A0ABQ7USW9_SOLTU|nr:hypothetical protein KY290_024508 [Solanum tuberosum]